VNFLKRKTVILVAHWLLTVSIADHIAVLEDGKIVQRGSFNELIAQPGMFKRLWEKQAHESEDPANGSEPVNYPDSSSVASSSP
jgi:ABC-type multidrug transport system fused ATPase/permease subunit